MNMQQRGFTLLESLIVVLLVGVLFAIALPAFNNITKSMAVTTTADTLLNTMNYARGMALQLNKNVAVIPVNAADWSNGWCVAATQSDGTLATACGASGKTYLRNVAAPSGTGWTFTGTAPSYQFNTRGYWANASATASVMAVTICRTDVPSGRKISIMTSGRVTSAVYACP